MSSESPASPAPDGKPGGNGTPSRSPAGNPLTDSGRHSLEDHHDVRIGAAPTGVHRTIGAGSGHGHHGPHGRLGALALGALGVVYGDIGTSPLYALNECFHGGHGLPRTPENVLGILSLVFWSLILVVVIKYLTVVMRADNQGEGGILALLALVMPTTPAGMTRSKRALLLLGLFGAALLYGDGVITPAISVLSAVEGIEVATASLHSMVVPITIPILVGLFMLQRRGTGGIGRLFGPMMLLWFVMIGGLGLPAIFRSPAVLSAINPLHAVTLFQTHGVHAFLVLGSVVLVMTGGEALYADMGHFGRGPIRVAWYAVVLPSLLLNYFGQGALLMQIGSSAPDNVFFALVPRPLLYPAVVIACLAAIIASQALISGAFSLTQQALQLGYWPRMSIIHTSGDAEGQIYIPEINSLLMVACLALVVGFRHSSALAAAYGIAVTGTMAITSVLFYAVARERFEWSPLKAGSIVALFLVIDLTFFAANSVKFLEGGWFPLVVAGLVFTVMTTWKLGRLRLGQKMSAAMMPLDLFVMDLEANPPHRVRGTAVFMTSNADGVPLVLLHHFRHNKVLHEQVVLLSIVTERVPIVSGRDRVEVTPLGHGFYRVVAHYGFMQLPSVHKTMRRCSYKGLVTNPADTSFFLGRETLIVKGGEGMARWRKILFSYLSRNSRPATAFFGLEPNRVVELGAQIEL